MTTAIQNVDEKRIDSGEKSEMLLELSEKEKTQLKALVEGDEAALMRAYEMYDTMEREAKAAMASIAAHLGYRPS
jgi:hypothetical protein